MRTSPPPARRSAPAFTLIEIMVVVVLLSVIVLGLMAMFGQTQRAFRAGMAQTDVLEGGRMATEMISRELEQIVPSDAINPSYPPRLNIYAPNFYAQLTFDFEQSLTPSVNLRTNVQHDLFFITRENQTWKGIGYFVRSNENLTVTPVLSAGVGTLYRFEASLTQVQFSQNPGLLFQSFLQASSGGTNFGFVSKLLDGVVGFKIRSYDVTNNWITPRLLSNIATNYSMWTSNGNFQFDFARSFPVMGEVYTTYFFSNAVPAFVEFELGVLESHAYEQYKSIPLQQQQTNYLAKQAGRVHVFRQRVTVRNIDPSAYLPAHP